MSYGLYKSQTKKSSIWRTDEIAQTNYDFHKLKEEEIISPDAPQGTHENYSNSDTEKQVTAPDSPNIENGNLEPFSTTDREWPFSTYKKIIYFKYDSNRLSPESLEILDKIADFAIHNPENEFIIKGYGFQKDLQLSCPCP